MNTRQMKFFRLNTRKKNTRKNLYAQGLYFSEPRKFVAACYGVKH